MLHTSMRLLLLTIVLAAAGVSFKQVPTQKAPPAPTAKVQPSYYWYSYPDDTYNDFETLAQEEWEMWVYYDAPVDNNPTGGQLIERGYINTAMPHEFPPSYFLYVHY